MNTPIELTPEQRQRLIEQNPTLKTFCDSGDAQRMAHLVSIAYLLHTTANTYAEEAVEIMQKYDLVHKRFKTRAINLENTFDAFDEACMDVFLGRRRKPSYKETLQLVTHSYEDFKAYVDDYDKLHGG